MSPIKLAVRRKSLLGVLAVAAVNLAIVMAVTGVSYAATDQMMQDYSGSSMSMNSY